MTNKSTNNEQPTMSTFLEYLNTCNQALDAHRDQFPYKQIMKVGDKLAGDKNIGVAVYKGKNTEPHDFFTMTIQNGHLVFVAHGKDSPAITWKTSESYLEDVVNNKKQYIDNPAKLDFDWIKDRVGVMKS